MKIEALSNVIITSKKEDLHMPNTIRRHLPAKLDRAACIAFLESVDPQLTPATIQAAGQVDIYDVDSVIEFAALPTDESFRLKSALVEVGLLSRGRRINR